MNGAFDPIAVELKVMARLPVRSPTAARLRLIHRGWQQGVKCQGSQASSRNLAFSLVHMALVALLVSAAIPKLALA